MERRGVLKDTHFRSVSQSRSNTDATAEDVGPHTLWNQQAFARDCLEEMLQHSLRLQTRSDRTECYLLMPRGARQYQAFKNTDVVEMGGLAPRGLRLMQRVRDPIKGHGIGIGVDMGATAQRQCFHPFLWDLGLTSEEQTSHFTALSPSSPSQIFPFQAWVLSSDTLYQWSCCIL